MRPRHVRSALVLAVLALVVGAFVPGSASGASTSKPTVATADPLAMLRATANQVGMGDPDLPPVGHEIDPKTYLTLRSQQEALYRGAPFTLPYNAREVAIQRFDRQMAGRVKTGPAWTAIGPAPIPNGQTSPANPVSGRVTAIAVDPTDANVVYVGTAQGGVYRSKNGGTSWTPLMDNAASLAIGSLALAPSDNSILYVGTGEGNLSGDSYAGVGLYRIDSANGTTPVLHGPFESRVAGTGTSAGNGHAFNFLAIQGIAIDPANADRVYLSATPGGIGVGGDWVCCVSPSADPGLYFTSNGTAATPTFSKVNDGLPQSSGSFLPASTDVKFLQGSSSTLLVGIEDIGFQTSANNGIWRSITADQATPTFSHISLPNAPFNTRIATSTAKVIVGAETNSGGRLFESTDGGATFPTTVTSANGFCGGQCFYDMAPAVDPNDVHNMLLGGSADSGGANVLMRATDGNLVPPTFSTSDAGLHADSHATAYAVTNTGGQHVVYAGDDGGIFKSTDGGATWSSLNNSGFSATQFESLAVHPTDPNFTIGGTQDNGTEWFKPNATWTRADFGDGGFARIDQTASNTTSVTMYHTYFNQTNNLIGFARVTSTANATEGNWNFFGCGGTANGISCADDPLFYAPLELGAVTTGHQNVYFGTSKLYRSVNQGVTMTPVSQGFGGSFTGKISAIGVTTQDDNVRIVGLNGGGIFGTTSGSSTLDNLDNSGQIPNSYVARIVIDPTNADVAYVTIGGFQGGTTASDSHVWKTTNINSTATSWTAINTGLPDVPVNAFVIDPNDHTHLFAGTDIGVYASTDSGANWAPFGTGLPVVAIFDMAIAQPGTGGEVLRVATHGRGMYEAALGGGGGATLTVQKGGSGGGTVTSGDGHINCGGSCSFLYTPGDSVTLTATPDGTSTFSGWGANCDTPSGNQCAETVNASETITASFDANDSTNPTAGMTKPTASVTISKSIGLQWNANDTGGSGLDNVDIRVKSAKFNAGFGSFTQPASLQHLTGTSTTFTGAAGTSYCFSVRARDNAGNLSAFSATKCTMIPVDDKTLAVRSGTWQRKTGQAGAFNGTLTIASAHTASLTLANLHARQVGIMVKKCSNCGILLITFAGGQTFQADTSGSGFGIFTLPATSSVKTGTLTLQVGTSGGHPVQIDGVVAPQTGSITLSAPSGRIRQLG